MANHILPARPPSRAHLRKAAGPAPAGAKPGRPAYVVNDKDRTMVRLLCAGGITQDRIADAIGVSAPTLRKHYRRDIMVGQAEIDAQAINTLVAAMRGGGKEAVAAAIWWTRSRMGWTERTIVDDGRPADTQLRVIVELVGDPPPPRVEQPEPGTGARSWYNPRESVQLVG